MANSNNIAAYLILCSLSNGSKYGLEIIESISARTGGHYIMKKPTLYSALTRMEKKGLVSSSFWQTSDMGGKRHYYTITNDGKKELETLETEFAGESFDDFDESSDAVSNETSSLSESNDSPIVGWQDNLFNLTETKTEEKREEKTEASKQADVVENQIDMFSIPEPAAENQQKEAENQQKMEYYQSILEQQPIYAEPELPKQDDGVFLSEDQRISAQQEEQNQRLYNTSNDLKRYRKHKSFAENQIEMSVEYETEDDREIQRERIENLKNSLLNFKQHQNETIKTSEPAAQEPTPVQNVVPASPVEEPPRLDDAVFITSRYSESEIPVQKKITPPNIDIDVSDDNLPAPKRNANLEPTYKDLMAKLYERKKEKEKQVAENSANAQTQPTNQASNPNISYETKVGSFVDYASLQKYYAERGIGFKEYKKTSVQHEHNTNFLQFISSVVLLFLSGVGCAAIFGIVAGAKLLNASTNFLFYTVPCIFLLYTIFTFVRDKVYPSKKASLTYNAVINWAVFLLSLVVIVVANVICGMQYEIYGQFLTSLLVPAYAMLLAFPCNYYIKKYLYKRYAK